MKLLKRLFGHTDTTQAAPDPSTLAAAAKKILGAHTSLNKIVNDYGATLASSAAPFPGCVADACKLPYPKEDIKMALLHMLRVVEDAQLRSALKMCYISLAQWQEGVGDTDVGLDFSKIDTNANAYELAKWVASHNDSAWKKAWSQMSAELETLRGDLQKLGLWDGP